MMRGVSLSHSSKRPADAMVVSLLKRASAFFQHDQFERTGVAILRKRRHLLYLCAGVRILGATRLGNALLIIIAVLTYKTLRWPTPGRVFQFGMTENNVRVLRRVNSTAKRDAWNDSINGRRLAFSRRLRVVSQFAPLWMAATALTRRMGATGFSHAQLVLTVSAYLVYRQETLRGVACVCVASDHSPVALGLLHAARENGLRTCYVQHAPVADYFPPLDYDLSILFDRASAATYQTAAANCRAAVDGRIVLLPPFETDAVTPRPLRSPPFRVGICLSYVFNAEAVERLIKELLVLACIETVSVRRHPRCKANFGALRIHEAVAEAPPQTLAKFARDCDVILVPNSGVAIELLHLGAPAMYTPGVDTIAFDYYGFVKAGVVPLYNPHWLTSPDRLAAFFDEEWRQRFALYDETILEPLAVSRDRAGKAFRDLVEKEVIRSENNATSRHPTAPLRI